MLSVCLPVVLFVCLVWMVDRWKVEPTHAMELREYRKNSDKDHAMRYHKARDAAWASISDVLQIPKE